MCIEIREIRDLWLDAYLVNLDGDLIVKFSFYFF